MSEQARFLPCRPCDRAELCACYWPTLATRAAGTHASQGAPGTTPGTTPREASAPRGASAGGSAASRGDALGPGNPPLSGPRGAPRAHAPSLPYLGLAAPDLRPGRKPAHGDGGGNRNIRTVPSVAGAACRHDQGPQASASPSSPRGFLVARGPPGLGALPPIAQMAAVGVRVPPAHGLLGSSGTSHPLSPTQSLHASSMARSASGL